MDSNKRCKSEASDSDAMVELVVGGREFSLSKTNLTQYPHSMLGCRFRGEEDGVSFPGAIAPIDRSADLFESIADFIRTGHVSVPKGVELADVYQEALFYGLDKQMFPDGPAKRMARIRMEAEGTLSSTGVSGFCNITVPSDAIDAKITLILVNEQGNIGAADWRVVAQYSTIRLFSIGRQTLSLGRFVEMPLRPSSHALITIRKNGTASVEIAYATSWFVMVDESRIEYVTID